MSNPINTRIIKIDPKRLKLLDLNARYMRHEVFARLVQNIREDGGLTGNAPFAWQLHNDATQEPILTEEGQPIYEVLSGNHRAKASITADLPEIDVCITDDYLPPDRRKAIQLSHNAITGEDDPATLKLIYDSIESPALRLYSGLDDKQLMLLDGVAISSLSEAGMQYQPVTLMFLPHEVDQLNAVFTQARKAIRSDAYWLASMKQYDDTLDALELAQQAHGIKNTATALILILEIFSRHLDDLQEGFLTPEDTPRNPSQKVPLVAILNTGQLPSRAAAKIKQAAQKLNLKPAEALEHMADLVLKKEKAE